LKRFPRPQVELIEDIVRALGRNYEKFEEFHKQEILYKNSLVKKAQDELRSTEAKLQVFIKTKAEGMSSYE
jgi:hypothetical protein